MDELDDSKSRRVCRPTRISSRVKNEVETPTVPNTAGPTSWTKSLGNGAYGTVHKSLTKEGDPIAVKICQNTGKATGISNLREIDMLVRLNRSPFVVDIKNICFINPFKNKEIPKKNTEKVSIFMEYIEENGKEFFKDKSRCTPLVAQKLFAQLLIGKKSMDNEKIMHRDIKPDNLLIGKKSNGEYFIKICDFGLSQSIASNSQKTPGVVTYPYRAPEICAELDYNASVDTWAIACTAFEMFGTAKFIGNVNETRESRKILSEIIHKLPIKPSKEKLMPYKNYILNRLIPEKSELEEIAIKLLHNKIFKNTSVTYKNVINLLIDINEDKYKDTKFDFSEHEIFDEIRKKKPKEISNFLKLIYNSYRDIYPNYYEICTYDLLDGHGDKSDRITCISRMCMSNNYKNICNQSGVDVDKLEDLLVNMLNIDYLDRYNADDCLEHPFFDNIRDYIKSLLNEVKDKISPQPLDIVNIYPCIERQWIFQIIEDIKKQSTDWFNYRIIFHAIDLFDRYLHYAFTNPDIFPTLEKEEVENGKVIRGKLHTYHDTAIRFYSCLYIFYKYFSSWEIELSWENFVPRELSSPECTKIFTEFEIFLFHEVSEYNINRQTLYEVADDTIEFTNSFITKLLKYYGDKNLSSQGECGIRSHLRNILKNL